MPEESPACGNSRESLTGLSTERAGKLLAETGKNTFGGSGEMRLFRILADIFREPMFLLLLFAALLYFVLKESREGFLMLLAMAFVTVISIYQEMKSSKALAALKKYTAPKVKCIRDGVQTVIDSEELVPGDLILLEEGGRIPADALVLQSNDLSVSESIVTGESFPATKDSSSGQNQLYQGTTLNSGKCLARVIFTGDRTLLGRIGKAAADLSPGPTPLQRQIAGFIKAMAVFGGASFILVWAFSYGQTHSVTRSLLIGLTLAMSAIPEEIPVAFSSFLALGAWRMARLGIIVRQPLTVENLGAVSVLCLDKTGTLTENKMQVSAFYDHASQREGDPGNRQELVFSRVLWYARLACEADPFDAMEKAIVEACLGGPFPGDYKALRMIHEYPLEGHPPMMTHVYGRDGSRLVAAKGGPERIIRVCRLSAAESVCIQQKAAALASRGYRVLGVASASFDTGDFPQEQDAFAWQLEGLIALYDPPKGNIKEVVSSWSAAGIRVKILSGDYPETVLNIAAAAGLSAREYLTGDQVSLLSDQALRAEAARIDIFARMFPDAKLRVIEALKAHDETVAMTGDGVNDAPALKASHIGIAMGNEGAETAREVADLIISDDRLEKITEAVRHGRTIYDNLRKAIRYLISIHIPILLTASLPVLLGWRYPNVFYPIHIIFLEIIMGPTCSIFYEREPSERHIMLRPPRDKKSGLFNGRELVLTLLQGVTAATGLLVLYHYFMHHAFSLEYTRTMVFSTLVFDNMLLTFVSRSFTLPFSVTIRYRNGLVLPVLLLSALFLAGIYFLPFVRSLFGLTMLSPGHALVCVLTALATTGWFEIYKALTRKPA